MSRRHGAHRPRRADALRDLRVTPNLAVWNGLELPPDTHLEVGAMRVERNREDAKRPGEVCAELAVRLVENRVSTGWIPLGRAIGGEIDGAQSGGTRCQPQPHARGAFDDEPFEHP